MAESEGRLLMAIWRIDLDNVFGGDQVLLGFAPSLDRNVRLANSRQIGFCQLIRRQLALQMFSIPFGGGTLQSRAIAKPINRSTPARDEQTNCEPRGKREQCGEDGVKRRHVMQYQFTRQSLVGPRQD